MSIERGHLIELYKATLEETRHQDAMYMLMYAALGIVVALFLAAVGFLFGLGLLRFPLVTKLGILILLFLVEMFFFAAFSRIHRVWEACTRVSEKVERNLGEEEFAGLLIGREMRQLDREKWHVKNRFKVSLALGVLVFIAFGLLLFIFLD